MPSNSSDSGLPVTAVGSLNVLRYQPVPPGRKPVPLLVPPVGVGSSSMLQSCGRRTLRQPEAADPGAGPRAGADRVKPQPAPKSVVLRASAGPHRAPSATTASTMIRLDTAAPLPKL